MSTRLPWSSNSLVAKGRNPFNTNALCLEHDPSNQSLRLANEVTSNGKTTLGWAVVPADPAYLRALAAELTALADALPPSP